MAKKVKAVVQEVEEGVVEETEAVVEVQKPKNEKIEVDVTHDPRRWYVRLWERNEPRAKDVAVANIFYSEVAHELQLEDLLLANYGAAIDALFTSTQIVTSVDGHVTELSPVVDPEHWIRNLYLAEHLVGSLYASEAQASYERYET